MHTHVAHTSHDTTKSSYRGEDPAHPQGPAKGQQHVGLRPAGNPQIAWGRLHVDGLRRRFKLFGDGIGKRARFCRQRKTGIKCDTDQDQSDPQDDFFHGASLINLVINTYILSIKNTLRKLISAKRSQVEGLSSHSGLLSAWYRLKHEETRDYPEENADRSRCDSKSARHGAKDHEPRAQCRACFCSYLRQSSGRSGYGCGNSCF